MRIAIVHNVYGKTSGEEIVVEQLSELLRQKGHEVFRHQRSSEEILDKWLGTAQAFAAGIYNPFEKVAFGRLLDTVCPDIVHIHNLFPLISPAVLPECSRRNVPVVMTLHNYRYICPNALLMRDGQPCHECIGGREWKCVLHNCERRLAKSIGYALRTAFARRSGIVLRHVRRFICLTQFQKDTHIAAGFPQDRIVIIPNPAPASAKRACCVQEGEDSMFDSRIATANASSAPVLPQKQYVGYVGRVSPEKDVPTLLNAAKMLPTIQFKIAGDYWRMPELIDIAPPNVAFLGHLHKSQLEAFFAGMGVFVFTTRCYENFPTVLLEAMAAGIPIVCTRIGGLAEIVDDERCGLHYKVGDAGDLAKQIERLCRDAALRGRLASSSLAKVAKDYSAEDVYCRTLEVYQSLIGRCF